MLANIPASVRKKGLPASELSLAADARAAEERGGEALWKSHHALGAHSTEAQTAASDRLIPHVRPNREIDGWVVQVRWSIVRDRGGSHRYYLAGAPPFYELSLRLPDELAGYEIWLWGYNYDFGSSEFSCPNIKLESVKDGDWVRVFGVLRPGSRVEWLPTKADELISLGDVIISDIQRLEVVQE
jgi:hypothetical protein